MSISVAPNDATIIAQKIVAYLDEAEKSAVVAELYVKGCEALYVSGKAKRHECGAKFAKIIRDLKYPNDPKKEWHSGYYWETVKAAGYTRSSDGNLTPPKEQKISSLLKAEDPTTWPESPYFRERLPLIQYLQDDVAVTQQMILELQRNFEQRELEDGTKEDDPTNRRKWDHLFASIDATGHVRPYPKEDVDGYLKLLTDMRAKLQKTFQRYMDERRAMMPWMIWQLKLRGDIISKAWWGKQYYVMFKRKDSLTPKKLTQFEDAPETVADFLNWVGTDSWKFGYCEFIPCPHCLVSEKDKIENENKQYLLQMFPFADGHWSWHCANCNTSFHPELLSQSLEQVAKSANGIALDYLKRNGIPIPEKTEQMDEEEAPAEDDE